jgi:hypothetical protein
MQYLTHCFAFQIEEEGYGSTFESESTVGQRKKRTKEVGTTYVPRYSLQLLKERFRVSYSASWHSNPICLCFYASLTLLITTFEQYRLKSHASYFQPPNNIFYTPSA